MKKQFWIVLILIIGSVNVSAQWECRSKLAAHLSPIAGSDLLWAAEFTLGGGVLSHNNIYNYLGLVALDYSFDNSTFYIEGGGKYWQNRQENPDVIFKKGRPGLREAYFKNRSKFGDITIGLQSITLNDDYLLNERILGLNYKLNSGKWMINLTGGTVSQDFSRQGTFCGTCFLYDIIPGRQRNLISHELGRSNFTVISFSYSPRLEVDEEYEELADDEFADVSDEFSDAGDEFEDVSDVFSDASDEFGEFDETVAKSTPFAKIEETGAVLYTEFGSIYNNLPILGGLFFDLSFFEDWHIKPELLYQAQNENNGIIFNFSLRRDIIWENTHKTGFVLEYTGFSAIDDNAFAANSFQIFSPVKF